jgi:Phosphate-selective porin O and P
MCPASPKNIGLIAWACQVALWKYECGPWHRHRLWRPTRCPIYRVSTISLNDQLGTANGVAGGGQTIYAAGLNWYVNSNVRFMFDYLHGNIAKQVSPTNTGDAGARFDTFAMRTQVAF